MNDELKHWIEEKLEQKKLAFDAGCLGALNDVVFICHKNNIELPKWAAIEMSRLLNAATTGNKSILQKWSKWRRRYIKDMEDFFIYELVKEAVEHGIKWDDAYDVAASIKHNSIDVNRAETISKAYKRCKKRLFTEPYRYYLLQTHPVYEKKKEHNSQLWDWIKKQARNNTD